jgi:deazaflavin-dependent oxidoreductase (nitroreductase family)
MSGIDYDAVNQMNAGLIEEFRANGGALTGPFAGRPIVLLTIKGRKTGKERTTPLVYLPHDGRVFVFASKGGAPEDPGWYRNLAKNPDVEVQVRDEVFPAHARVATGEERDRLWELAAQQWPDYDGYQERTDREIPVIVLERES